MSTAQIANSIFCVFEQVDHNLYECKNCGSTIQVINGYGPPIIPCSKTFTKSEKDISIGSKILNFAKSLVEHTMNGSPTCSSEQINKRYEICQLCEFLKDNKCTKCGCPISRTSKFISKLAWADQECPIGKWNKEI